MNIHISDCIRSCFYQWCQLIREYHKTYVYLDRSCLIYYDKLVSSVLREKELNRAFLTLQDIVSCEKLSEFIQNIELLYKVSASGEGRAWGGVKQANTSSHHKVSSFLASSSFNKLLENLIEEEISYSLRRIDKHPGFKEYVKTLELLVNENAAELSYPNSSSC